MSNKLLVGNLSKDTSEDDLTNLFNRVGLVLSTTINVDGRSGRRTNSGFVFMTEEGAQEAVRVLNGTLLHEQEITITLAD